MTMTAARWSPHTLAALAPSLWSASRQAILPLVDLEQGPIWLQQSLYIPFSEARGVVCGQICFDPFLVSARICI